MTTISKLGLSLIFISGLVFISAFNNTTTKEKNEGRCTGSKYCNVCKNCSRCAHCGAGGVCGVCSPESFVEKPKSVKKKNKENVNKIDTTKKR